MSIHIDTILDELFALLRHEADEAQLRDILVDVWVVPATDSVWGSVGERRGELTSRSDIADNLYRERAPTRMKLLVRNAKVNAL